MTIELRPYQRQALDDLYGWFEGNAAGDPLVVLPTGAGKSLVMAQFLKEAIEAVPDAKILSVTHVKELIRQNFEELHKIWPFAPAGIYSAGVGRKEAWHQITFCGIQSVHTSAHKFGAVDLVLIDEAHLVPRKAGGMYHKFLAELRKINPKCRLVGLTATPYRLDSGMLIGDEDAVFGAIAHETNVGDLVRDGYLAPLTCKSTSLQIDTTGVHRRSGDFIPGELAERVDQFEITNNAVDEILRRGADRRSWLVFAASVQHAEHIAEAMRSRGISCQTITGETPGAERDATIAAFKNFEIRCLASVGVLTTGFNAPSVDLIALLRPTLSTGLYVQMLGRGMRLAPGKTDCLVLDFAGLVMRHGPVDAVRIPEPGKGEGDAPVKSCPECDTIVHASVRQCPSCQYQFPKDPEPEIQARPYAMPVMTVQPPMDLVVHDWWAAAHQSKSGHQTLKVTYWGNMVQTEWVCFEHDGFAREKACKWWTQHKGSLPFPGTVAEALQRFGELQPPACVTLSPDPKNPQYYRIIRREFARERVNH